MQHTPAELMRDALLCYESYHVHNHVVDNIEFKHSDFLNHQTLAFRGTSRNRGKRGWLGLLWDIVSDIRFLPRTDTDYGLGRHPAGFLEAAEDIVEYIHFDDNPIDPYKPTHLTGHSMGGAVLLIAAPVLMAHGMNIESVTTFGAPNVGALPELPGVKISCIKNGRDIVTSVPPFYGDSYETTVIGIEEKGFIEDHYLMSYIEAITTIDKRPA